MLFGFLIAPMVPGLVLEAARLFPAFRGAAGFGVLIYSYPVALLFGVPAFLIFERSALRRLWHYALGGFLFMQLFVWGLLFSMFSGELDEPDFTYAGVAGYSAILGMLGASASIAFWSIAVRPSAAHEARIAASEFVERGPPPTA